MPVFLVLLVMMLVEIAVIVAVGQAIGVLVTILLLIAVSVVGVAMLRRQGMRTLAAFGDAVRSRRDPQPEMADGMLVGVAAGLVLFPGFVSDLLALFLLFPPTRAIVRRRLVGRAQRRRPPQVIVVDSEVVHEEQRPPIVIESVREDRD
ncbi:MAG TPA: FxsA family protein [Actinophytocola sp.]|uniref:FxsA family protein n=1 Tax=Actinophytocola sp. TaxID=1872138 RepID=UPI002F91FE8B